ncbi:MAG: HAMP domain-containing sensor histidine kinase [Pseudomonadota bacterium]
MPQLDASHGHRLLALMLLTLCLSSWLSLTGIGGAQIAEYGAQTLFLLHIGLLLLWLRTWSVPAPLNLFNIVALLTLLAVWIVFLQPWLLVLWKILLLSLLAGRELNQWLDRSVHIAALCILSLDLALLDAEVLFVLNALPAEIEHGLRYGGLAALLLMLFIPASTHTERLNLDFFYGLAFVLCISILIVVAVLLQDRIETLSYPVALSITFAGLISFLVLLSWLWLSLGDFDGVSQLWSRHMFSIGSAFEQWLANLTQPGNYKQLDPEQFLMTGFEQLLEVPWITGVSWYSNYGAGTLGTEDGHNTVFNVQSMEVTLYSDHRITGSYHAHAKLMVQLLEYFHQAKQREETYAQQSHLQAIHETGAKLTHDIKNLLQSLYVITSAIESVQPEQFGDTQRLLQGQLPHLSQRLKRTLDKLQQPEQSVYINAPIRTWWDNLRARYVKRDIDFSMSIMWNTSIPEDLFDNVIENLLENALNKRKREPSLSIHVSLSTKENSVQVTVCDDGSPIPPEIEKYLLSQPVQSRDGFGIGLYQAAKQTIHSDYRLTINSNESSHVCFELANI